MANSEWLTPRQLRTPDDDERQSYVRRIKDEMRSEDSDDEPMQEDTAECGYEAVDDSDVEEMQLPEYNPEDESDSDEELGKGDECYIAKDGTIWSTTPPQTSRFHPHNVLRSANCGPVRETEGLTIVETFRLLMSDEMCDIIIRETNRKANQYFAIGNSRHPTREKRTWKPVTKGEFDAYLGLLLQSGVTHSGSVHTTELWKTTSHPLYRAAMDIGRFWEINRFIRFDNGNTREQRKQTYKAAAISDIFFMLNSNLSKNYVARANVTVGEQLYGYRGGTGFTQYIPSKPEKYGIKVWWVCDSISSYPLKGQIYTGMAASGISEKNAGERVVKDLCVDLFGGSGRNVVCDKFFTTYNLAKSLMLDDSLSLLGRVNKRRTFVPSHFANAKGRQLESTIFGFSNNIAMCSYVQKKNKPVVLLSTSHYTTTVQGPKKKPLMEVDYNANKGGVDNMERSVKYYSTKRRTQRWPLAFFYNILDVAAFAAYTIYVENNPHLKASTSSRKEFLEKLSEQLAKPEIEERANNSSVYKVFSTLNAIEAIIGGPLRLTATAAQNDEERDSTGRIKRKGNCYLCAKRRPTRKTCSMCMKPVCAEHATDMPQCKRCYY